MGNTDSHSSKFETMTLPKTPTAIAPDGSEVRVLLALKGGSMAQFKLLPGETAIAVSHRTVEEIWFVQSGRGEMWRKQDEREEIVPLEKGVCLTIPLGTHFQFRASDDEALTAVAITMPPWPSPDEAYVVDGKWPATAGRNLDSD